jgi:hypothetical protein
MLTPFAHDGDASGLDKTYLAGMLQILREACSSFVKPGLNILEHESSSVDRQAPIFDQSRSNTVLLIYEGNLIFYLAE